MSEAGTVHEDRGTVGPGDGWLPPARGAEGLRRWSIVVVGAGALTALVLLRWKGFGVVVAVAVAVVVLGVVVLLAVEVVDGRRVPSNPTSLWHPDDFVVQVDRTTGRVVESFGAVPTSVGSGAPPTGRAIDDLLLSPRFAHLQTEASIRRRRGTSPFVASWRADDGTVRRSETVAMPVGPRLVLYGRDVTVAHDERDRLARRAATDPLTGLPNRAVLEQSLRTAAARSARTGQPWAVAVVDLDGFKALNDQRGHAAGDQALVAVAAALQDEARATDDVLRLGGDELVVVVHDLVGPDAADQVVGRLLAAVRRGGAGRVTASVGLAVGVGIGDGPERLLDVADASMYEAKRAGGDAARVAVVGEAFGGLT